MMEIVSSVKALQTILDTHRIHNKKIGFVPTMGALHEGHLSLIYTAAKKCDVMVCSIFVNPTQFNNKTDLAKYPRTLNKDVKMLKKAGCHILFVPDIPEVYPKGLNTKLDIDFKGLDKVMEGKFRPGHFDGMAEVVNRLLSIVKPDHLYMGQKDFQQFTIVAHMIKALKLPIVLNVCTIMREANGLAMSSRNERLSKSLRNQSSIIYKTLNWAFRNRNKYSTSDIEKKAMEKMSVTDFKPEYFSIVDGYTLKPVKDISRHKYVVACTAVWVGGVRLIDNKIFKKE